MYPRTINTVVYALGIIGAAVIGVSIASGWLGWTMGSPYATLVLLVIGFAINLILPAPFIFLVPVRCPIPGCHGQMHREWVGDCFSKDLFVKCPICGYVFEMPATMTFGES